MLLQQTIDVLEKLHLHEMTKGLREQEGNASYQELGFSERLGLLADRELVAQENRILTSRLRKAKLRQNAEFEDIDLKTGRGVNRTQVMELGACSWVRNHENLLITGPTGVGKTYLACALSHKACREGFSVSYYRLSKLLYELNINRGEGRYLKTLKAMARIEILVFDDWGLEILGKDQRNDLLEILEDRNGRKSTLITSQLPIQDWHSFIGDQTIADAILDRLIHNAHIIQLKGDSMRKKRPEKDERKTAP